MQGDCESKSTCHPSAIVPSMTSSLRFGPRRTLSSTLGLALALMLAGCGMGVGPPGAEQDASQAQVVAADGVLCDLTTTLAGADVLVGCLLEPGDDPHTFALTPSDKRRLESADHVFANGLTLTPQLEVLRGRDSVTWTAEVPGITPVSLKGSADHDGGHDHGDEDHAQDDGHRRSDQDPHVWNNPANISAMAVAVAAELERLAPEQAAGLQQRRQAAQDVLSDLDAWAEQAFSSLPPEQRTLATPHRAFATLSQRYGLHDVAVAGAHGASELLLPDDVARLTETLQDQGVTILFPEQLPPGKALAAIASRTGVSLADARLFPEGMAPGSSLVATFVTNVCTITDGLGGGCDEAAGEQLNERWKAIRTQS